MHNIAIASINPLYQKKILDIHQVDHTPVGELFKVTGYTEHNHLVDINKIFSKNPAFGLADRNKHVKHPIKNYTPNSFVVPGEVYNLDQAAQATVEKISAAGTKINVFWSGGIDSTFVTTAFLKHLADLSQLRILYTPWSTYEHPEYLKFLANFPQVELIDISGEVYLTATAMDGCYVTGDGGDESHASLDESFFNAYGFDALHTSWIDFFRQQNKDETFIEFCQGFFAKAGRPIESVLEARWWFYITCKYYGTMFYFKWPFIVGSNDNFSPDRLISFFDTEYYQSFAYYNTDKIIVTDSYAGWKQFLKDYCYEFDQLATWRSTHKKLTSMQIIDYSFKKIALLDRRWLMFLNDGTRIATPNLPFFSIREFDNWYGQTLGGLFNV